ncbi:MAG: PCP reductase family protein [Pseudanabaenaceae cyanobacterium bins.68]|nr:PCP reductase family protein [Pseudanabaenaceae cyanobacterium bins.68]
METLPVPPWTAAARAKLRNVPYFARTQAKKQIEQVAIATQAPLITTKIVEQARLEFGQ